MPNSRLPCMVDLKGNDIPSERRNAVLEQSLARCRLTANHLSNANILGIQAGEKFAPRLTAHDQLTNFLKAVRGRDALQTLRSAFGGVRAKP